MRNGKTKDRIKGRIRDRDPEKELILLTTEEMQAAKGLWSEIFYEDSQVFTDYYFREKMNDNIGYAIKRAGEVIAMLYLTPYEGKIRAAGSRDGFLQIPLYYIVGVGTKQEYRHQGCMELLLGKALSDIRKAGHPFTFLMPAKAEIYTPYQFRYIYDRPDFKIEKQKGGMVKAERMQEAEAEELAAFAEQQLSERFQFFLHRSRDYYLRQQKESRAQNGDVYLWKEKGDIRGYYLYAKEEKEFIQEALTRRGCEERAGLVVSKEKKPVIMARAADVCALLTLMRLKEEAPFEQIEVLLEITDPLLKDNNGTFLWTVGKKESTIAVAGNESRTVCKAACDVAELIEFLFGRKDARECFSCKKEAGMEKLLMERLSCIDVICHSFLNEIV